MQAVDILGSPTLSVLRSSLGCVDHPDLLRLRAGRQTRAATTLAHVFDPIVVVVAVLVFVSVLTSSSAAAGLGWAALALLFCAVLPEVALRIWMRRHGIRDRHLVVREHRHVPLVVSGVSVAVGVAVLALAGAPPAVLALVVTILAGVVVMTLATRIAKASFHVGVVASMAVVLVCVVGWRSLLLSIPVLLAVGWARVSAGRHSLPQVVAGLLLGAGSAAVVFPWLS